MASTWGLAWGLAWGSSWDITEGPTPPPTPSGPPPPSGGIPSDRGPTREQTRRSRVRFGIEREIIERVAGRQAEALQFDEAKRLQELEGELRLEGLEIQSRHIELLNQIYAELIRREIAERLRQRVIDEETAIILLVALGEAL